MDSGRDPRWVPRTRIRVDLITVDGEVFRGHIFVSPDMRVLDVLNGHQRFLPFETFDGEIEIISKSVIARLKPYDKPTPPRRREGEKTVISISSD
jgi:hypothetical protein